MSRAWVEVKLALLNFAWVKNGSVGKNGAPSLCLFQTGLPEDERLIQLIRAVTLSPPSRPSVVSLETMLENY